MSKKVSIAPVVNGITCVLEVDPGVTLLEVLRDQLRLTGAKSCCAEGECGACTVHLDGIPVNSCLVLAAEVDGCTLTTIEGFSSGGLTDLQEEFLAAGAVQCGFCIPGQVMAAAGLLTVNPDPSEAEVREAMAGNLCRCAGYQRIVAAVLATSARRQT